jgi:hypothetical protein
MNSFKSLATNWGAVVGNDPRPGFRVFSPGPFKDDFHVTLCHLLSDLPRDDKATASIQKAAQVIEGATDIEVREIHCQSRQEAIQTITEYIEIFYNRKNTEEAQISLFCGF